MIGSDGLKTISLPKYKTSIKVADNAPKSPKFFGKTFDLVINQEKVPKPMAAAANVKNPLGSTWLGESPTNVKSEGGLMVLAKS